jgi:hypothetical protein
MNKRLYCVCALALALALAAVPCLAAGQSWDGTWKLNEAKSKFTGETMTLEDKGNGMIQVSGGSVTYDFACDGKAYPEIADRTMTCTGSDAVGWEHTTKAGDKVLTRSHWAISADGKTITVRGKEWRPDGSTADYTEVWKREAGTSGVVGRWRSVKADEGTDSMVIERKGDWIKIYDPQYKSTVEGKMDGTHAPVTGPNILPGLFQTIKPDGPNKLHYTVNYNGKVLSEGTQTLSADGKTLVDEQWDPGKMSEKAVQVYERQ